MATNIDKALYQTPMGLDDLAPEEGIEIEIVDPEEVTIGIGDMELTLSKDDFTGDEFDANLAEDLPDSVMEEIASQLSGDIDADRNARGDWEKAYVNGLKLMGLQIEERTEPWVGASGVFHPMITEAVVRFQSETITETFPAQGPVRTKIVGKETVEKKAASVRVQNDMNPPPLALRSRKFTLTPIWDVKCLCLSPPRTSCCRTAHQRSRLATA